MAEIEQNILIVGTDRYGRTWHIVDRGAQFAVYYTEDGNSERHVIYDSQDPNSDPPRVLHGRVRSLEASRDTYWAAMRELQERLGRIEKALRRSSEK